MSNIPEAKHIHMVGIAGVGMSALAQFLKQEGKIVTGSDNAEFPTLAALQKAEIPYTIGYSENNIPKDVDLLIHTDAVYEDNPERKFAAEHNLPDISYFEALGEASINRKTIAVAGTHGKTTTTGMLTKILIDAGKRPTAIVGSIMKDFGSNFVPGNHEPFVVEACEYRGHFLNIEPYILVVTNIEWDHTDFYKNLSEVQEGFRDMMDKVPPEGAIVTDPTHPNIAPLLEGIRARIIDYTKEEAHATALIGDFNKNNARAAAAAARAYASDIPTTVMNRSLGSFRGTWRRFEFKGNASTGALVYDDYAHHPSAVTATLKAAKHEFPDKHIIVAFHPHLYSRTRDLMEQFAHAFKDADRVIVAPIYAAREKNDGTISNHTLAERIQMTGANAQAIDTFEEIEGALKNSTDGEDLIITMGAGDIYKVADKLVEKS